MNGPHDLGGMKGFGPVEPEANEPVFHADWEERALALTVGMGFAGMWNIDISRHARESLPVKQYRSFSYYQIWIAGLERLLTERGMISSEELESRTAMIAPVPVNREPPDRQGMAAALAAGGPSLRITGQGPKFAVGDRVKTKIFEPSGHTRLPHYAMGKKGSIVFYNESHVFPDSSAKGEGDDPKSLYTVQFDAMELFGQGAHSVTLDLWEPYLEAMA